MMFPPPFGGGVRGSVYSCRAGSRVHSGTRELAVSMNGVLVLVGGGLDEIRPPVVVWTCLVTSMADDFLPVAMKIPTAATAAFSFNWFWS